MPADPTFSPADLADRDQALAEIAEYLDWAVGSVRSMRADEDPVQVTVNVGATLRQWAIHDLAGLAAVAISRLADRPDRETNRG